MGIVRKMELLKWIRKYSTGILDTKTGSMETLIDSGSSKTINYAYTSSVIADDELINTAVPPHQRPMLPPPPLPPPNSLDSPAQLPNDVYDCCVSLDGIPIKHEFQYTLSDTDGCGKITKHDIEGLASKILESMYGTTVKFSSRGQRTVKVTLNVRQSAGPEPMPSSWSRERKNKSSADYAQQYYGVDETDGAGHQQLPGSPIYSGDAESLSPHYHHRVKSGALRYRRDQLIEMVEKSLAENLSFQNQRKSNKPEGYHRPRTKRRQSSVSAGTPLLQSTPLPSPPSSATKVKTPAKVAWSPYDFEPVAHVPSHHHHHEQLKNVIRSQQQMLYSNGSAAIDKHHVQVKLSSGGRQHHHRTAVVVSSNQQPKDSTTLQEQSKNIDHQRYKRAKLASKKIHHHIHEHHHYHHYDYYIV